MQFHGIGMDENDDRQVYGYIGPSFGMRFMLWFFKYRLCIVENLSQDSDYSVIHRNCLSSRTPLILYFLNISKGALPRWYIPWYIPWYISWYQAGLADFEQKSGGFCESAVDTRNPPDFDGPLRSDFAVRWILRW
jgi:hypothetical protein